MLQCPRSFTMVDDQLKGKFKDTSRHLTEHLTELAQSYYKLGILQFTDKSSAIISTSFVLALTGLLLLFFMFFAGIGIGFWLGEKMNNMFAGFAIVAAVFLTAAVTLYATRNRLLIPFLRNKIISKVYDR